MPGSGKEQIERDENGFSNHLMFFMRNELELLATIEKYLNNELSVDERAAFEKQLAVDLQLQEAVALQQQILKGIERAAYKQQIQLARKKFYLRKNFIKWGFGGVIISAAIIALV